VHDHELRSESCRLNLTHLLPPLHAIEFSLLSYAYHPGCLELVINLQQPGFSSTPSLSLALAPLSGRLRLYFLSFELFLEGANLFSVFRSDGVFVVGDLALW
jgi:hypothetical protein